jgi:hypothetical protein
MDWSLEFDERGQVATGRVPGVCHIAEVLPEVLASLLAESGGGGLGAGDSPSYTARCSAVLVDA